MRRKAADRAAKKTAPAKKGVARKAAAKKTAPRRAATKTTTRRKTTAAKAAPRKVAATKTPGAKPAVRRKPAAAKTPRPRSARALVPARPTRDDPHWSETLRDGTRILIRPIHKEDAALERAFIRRLSPESRRLRFLGQISEPSEDLIRALTDVDYRRDVAFVALVHRDGEKREIGVARYGTDADGKVCECAVTVADDWHNRGLGTLLMRHLIDVARERGIRTMISIDEADNHAMRDLAAYLGFERRADPSDPTQVIHTLELG